MPTSPAFDIARALIPKAAAATWGSTARVLARLRRGNMGPAFYDFHGSIFYLPEDVARWIESRRHETALSTQLSTPARPSQGEA